MRIKFTVFGEPKGKARPRFLRSGRAYTPRDTAEYEDYVRTCYKQAAGQMCLGDEAMIELSITAYFAIPKSTGKKKRAQMLSGEVLPAKKPDADNIAKIIADSLNKIAYHDDKQIVSLHVRKRYSDSPRVEVELLEKKKEENKHGTD